MRLKTQPNENRCWYTYESHTLNIEDCCPVSHNPLPGSTIMIGYRPKDLLLEVASLRKYVDSYIGGKGEIRSMEGMIQAIAKDCAEAIQTKVRITAELKINPNQEMHLICEHNV